MGYLKYLYKEAEHLNKKLESLDPWVDGEEYWEIEKYLSVLEEEIIYEEEQLDNQIIE